MIYTQLVSSIHTQFVTNNTTFIPPYPTTMHVQASMTRGTLEEFVMLERIGCHAIAVKKKGLMKVASCAANVMVCVRERSQSVHVMVCVCV